MLYTAILVAVNYTILRPPLTPTYELPTRDELLALKPGDLAKVTFRVANDDAERMWVILEDCSDIDKCTAKIDNDARQANTAKALPVGKLVEFHPFDIIAIE